MLKRSILGTSDIQGCYSPNGITYIIYTLLSGRDKIPFRTTYIEYRSPVKIFIHFIGFHCKNMCLVIVSRHRSWGIPFGELEQLIFLNSMYKKKNISWDLFFADFRHPGLLLPKGNYVYNNHT